LHRNLRRAAGAFYAESSKRVAERLCGLPKANGVRHGLESSRGELETIQGRAKEKWGRLTDDDLDVINGGKTNSKARFRNAMSLPRTRPKRMYRIGSGLLRVAQEALEDLGVSWRTRWII
jgi:hypothetical protein